MVLSKLHEELNRRKRRIQELENVLRFYAEGNRDAGKRARNVLQDKSNT